MMATEIFFTTTTAATSITVRATIIRPTTPGQI